MIRPLEFMAAKAKSRTTLSARSGADIFSAGNQAKFEHHTICLIELFTRNQVQSPLRTRFHCDNRTGHSFKIDNFDFTVYDSLTDEKLAFKLSFR